MSFLKTRRVIATTAVTAGLLLSGVGLALADEESAVPDSAADVEVTEGAPAALEVAPAEAETAPEETAPVEIEAAPAEEETTPAEAAADKEIALEEATSVEIEPVTEAKGTEESVAETLAPVTRSGAPKEGAPKDAKPTKVEWIKAHYKQEDKCIIMVTFKYPDGQSATTNLTFVRHLPNGTSTPPHTVPIYKNENYINYQYLAITDDCSEDMHHTITAEPRYEDSSVQTVPVTIELKGMKTVAPSNLQGAIKTVDGACVASFTWDWEHETPTPTSWDYEWHGPNALIERGSIPDPNARSFSFKYSEIPCPDEGLTLTVFVEAVLSEADAKTTLTKKAQADIKAPVVKKETKKPKQTKKSTETKKATDTKPKQGKGKQPGLAATGSHTTTLLITALWALVLGGSALAVRSRKKL